MLYGLNGTGYLLDEVERPPPRCPEGAPDLFANDPERQQLQPPEPNHRGQQDQEPCS